MTLQIYSIVLMLTNFCIIFYVKFYYYTTIFDSAYEGQVSGQYDCILLMCEKKFVGLKNSLYLVADFDE